MSDSKCGWCRRTGQVWTGAAWHARMSCPDGHVADVDLCGDCKALLETRVQFCFQDIRPEGAPNPVECREPLGFPEITAL